MVLDVPCANKETATYLTRTKQPLLQASHDNRCSSGTVSRRILEKRTESYNIWDTV